MDTLYKFHFLNGISEINQLFDDILIIWPAPVYSNQPEYPITEEKILTTAQNILTTK